MKLELRDPGMQGLCLTVPSYDALFAHLKRYNETYTAAYVRNDKNEIIMNAHREVGDRTWRIFYRSDV